MSTFEGPMLSIKSVNYLAHFTDWIIGHVHSGALGWNGFITFGMLYWLVPRLWHTEIYSKKLMSLHFWLATIGIIIYVVSMWVAGITQGLMWRALDESGNLVYRDFLETLVRLLPMYWVRLVGGTMYLVGMLICAYVIVKTIASAPAVLPDPEYSAPSLRTTAGEHHAGLPGLWGKHRSVEGMPINFLVLCLLAIVSASLFEFIPAFAIKQNIPTIAGVHPYTALELEGRDLYIREGCYTCHSQMIRPTRPETLRYGDYARAGEYVYDHPFQWGSRRIGPDLLREGGKYPDSWHVKHLENPQEISKGSIMPSYGHLLANDLDTTHTSTRLEVMKKLGVPYTDEQITNAVKDLTEQASSIGKKLASEGEARDLSKKEVIALVAYLQRLGRDFRTLPETEKAQVIR